MKNIIKKPNIVLLIVISINGKKIDIKYKIMITLSSKTTLK